MIMDVENRVLNLFSKHALDQSTTSSFLVLIHSWGRNFLHQACT